MTTVPAVKHLDAVVSAAHANVFKCLLQVNEESNLNAVLRVAGGWVRDTLLGLHSNDIDIAIESVGDTAVSGERFAREVSAFQAAQNMKSRTVSVIRVNPALSKHIETATVCVFDLPVEFCALRTDDYSDESRIPQVRVATPCEDALRRDFTINSLFYNLHTGLVEDYTSGLQDLQDRVIRCPLAPRETFTDDPLRLLRGVRFVGQLGQMNFRLHDSIPAAVDDRLLEILQQKVSRERIGKEFVKMMCGSRPDKCVDILLSMGILQNVLLVEIYMKQTVGKKQSSAEVERAERLLAKVPDSARALDGLKQLNCVVSPCFTGPDALLPIASDDKVVCMLFELLIIFFRGLPEDEVEERLYAICLNSLKLPLANYQALWRMINSFNSLLRQGLSLEELSAAPLQDSTLMKIFNALSCLNDRHVVAYAMNVVVLNYILLECRPDLLESGDVMSVHQLFNGVWSTLKLHPTLLEAFTLPLPVKGNELKSLLGVEARLIGALLLEARKYLVLNPDAGRDDVLQFLQKKMAAI